MVTGAVAFNGGAYRFIHIRFITKVRLKWVKSRSLDHIIDTDTDLKAACQLKDAIKRSATGFLTAKSVFDWKGELGLTVPVLRFLRRYPTIFNEFPHTRYANLPCFRLTETALLLDSMEQEIHQSCEADTVDRLSKILMMTKSRTIPMQSLYPLKWDLGLPDNFEKGLIPRYPETFGFVKSAVGLPCLQLLQWRDELAVSALQGSHETKEGGEYRKFKSGRTVLAFPMRFPKGYGAMNKVKAWMEQFQNLPYISPYEDASGLDPNSDLMEKRVVGVLHEFLSLTIHKKTWRNYLRKFRDELILPERFTRIFTRYPGIFYLSLKCKTTTITLREGYEKGKLVDVHPLARLRSKIYHVMRTGLLYREKGNLMIPESLLQKPSLEDEADEECEVLDDEE